MKDLLELILKNITTHPEEVVIEPTEEEGREVYTITVNPEDMGRVIGKNGKVIRAIRSLAHVVAIRQGKRFRINVAEVDVETPDNTESGENQPSAEDPQPTKKSAKADPAPTDDDLLSGAIDIASETPQEEKAE